VKEYIVWRTYDRAIDWFRLVDGAFERVEPVDGRVESSIFPGLILDIDALLEGNYGKVLAAVSPAQS
jgi:Uma2 family endonuclease